MSLASALASGRRLIRLGRLGGPIRRRAPSSATRTGGIPRGAQTSAASERAAISHGRCSATYNWQMCTMGGRLIDGYFGYRALSVDYSQGSGDTRYKYDVLMQGPVMGATLHF